MTCDDIQRRRDVEAELDWHTRFDSREIAVTVKNPVVTLTGFVDSYAQSRAALEAAQSVAGVSAVANELRVHLPTESMLGDSVTLEGEVGCLQERQQAEWVARQAPGVSQVIDKTVSPSP